jgi:hypothetical protein
MADVGSGSAFDYVQVSDPGAVGAGKTWLQLPPTISGTVVPAASLQLWRRNETDDGWTPIGAGDRFTTPVVEGHTYFWDAEGNPVSDIYRGADGEIDIYSLGGYGSTLSITAHDGMTLGGPSISLGGLIVTGNNWLPLVKIIHSDPTAGGGGFQAPLVFDDTAVTGGLYAWNEAGYLKVGGPLP